MGNKKWGKRSPRADKDASDNLQRSKIKDREIKIVK